MTLDEALNLPEDLEYTGEFGPELVLALPFFNWLSLHGLLSTRRIVTYNGMRCFYEDLGCREIIEKAGPRGYLPPNDRPAWLPVKDEHTFDAFKRTPFHIWPDLREKFGRLPMMPDIARPDRPILVIHNKHCDEWCSGPVNFLPIPLLRAIFETLSSRYTIVYIRHGLVKGGNGYVDDHNMSLDFEDGALLQEYDDVIDFADLYRQHLDLGGNQDLNTFKSVLYSRCHHFISSQGGGAHQIALFSGSMLAILHRRGRESEWAYAKGYYSFMADIPPITLVCSDPAAMMQALPAFVDAPIVSGRVMPRADMAFIASVLDPNRSTSV